MLFNILLLNNTLLDMREPGFVHQKWQFNIPTPIYNAVQDLGSAPLGIGGKYPISTVCNFLNFFY